MNESKESILIVDDEKLIQHLLQRKLTGEGYLCQQAGSAAEALEKLRKNPFSLILLDIKMPDRSGIELLPDIKSGYPETAIIMVTATDDINTAIECMKLGAYDYVTKPFNLDAVAFNVAKALDRRKLEIEIKEYHQQLEEKVAEQAEKIRSNFLNAIAALVYALEAKDTYTSGHSRAVSEIAVAIAIEMGLAPDIIEKARVAGLLHDIGKIGVRESVLNKPNRLSDEDFFQVQRHPEIGEHILSAITDDDDILNAIKHHHQHYDGTGYPDNLRGDRIPLLARILAVADAYEAMTSERSYRKAFSREKACQEIVLNKGVQFDDKVVAAFSHSKYYTINE